MKSFAASLDRPRARGVIASVALGVLWVAAAPQVLEAQSPVRTAVNPVMPPSGGQVTQSNVQGWPEGWGFGGSIGMPGLRMRPYPGAFTVGAHAHYLPRGFLGFEASLGLAPAALVNGLLLGGRAGLTVQLRTESVLILPTAGVSALAAGNTNDVRSSPALFYAGLTTLSRGGLRLGVTMHWVDASEGPAWLVEVGAIRLPNRGGTP